MDFKGFDAGALSGSNRAAIPFQAAVGEAQGNRRIQEEIKRDASDDWAQVLYNRGAGRSIFSPLSQASLFNVHPAVLSSIAAQNQPEAQAVIEEVEEEEQQTAVVGFPQADENDALLGDEVINQVAQDFGMPPALAVQAVREFQAEREDLVGDIIQRQREIDPAVNDEPVYRAFVRQAVGNLDPKFIAGTLFGSIPTLMDIYARYSKGKETARLIDAQKAVDGIPLTDKDIDIFTPAKRSIEEIKNSYTPPHCKRHFFTDRDGKVRSVLVCTDSAGTRSYFNH